MHGLTLYSFNATKKSMKSYVTEFEDDMTDCRENPASYEEAAEASKPSAAAVSDSSDDDISVGGGSSDSDSSDSDSSSGSDSSSSGSSDSSDSMFGSGSDSSSDSDSDDDERSHLVGRARWVKRATQQDGGRDKSRKQRVRKVRTATSAADVESQMTPADLAEHRLAVELSKVTHKNLEAKIRSILAARGRRGADVTNHIVQLEYLAAVAKKFGAEYGLPVDMHLVAARFDTVRGMDSVLSTEHWRAALQEVWGILDVLESTPDLVLAPLTSDEVAEAAMSRHTGEDGEGGEGTPKEATPAGAGALEKKEGDDEEEDATLSMAAIELREDGTRVVRTVGLLTTVIERLSDEFTKCLQGTDPHTAEYVARLKDEEWLVTLAGRVHTYFLRVGDTTSAARAALVRLQHMYYRHATVGKGMHDDLQANAPALRQEAVNAGLQRISALVARVQTVADSTGKKKVTVPDLTPAKAKAVFVDEHTADTQAEVARLASFIYANGDDRARTRALLCHVFAHALHDEFYAARDLLLMSKLQDSIHLADVPTQILFNRAMACLGTCAFREGLLRDAHACLAEICGSGHTKELLAQGTSRFADRSPAQERAERRRQTPYHMHIHAELLDACHMVSAMLLEVPNMAAAETNPRRGDRIISRDYRRMMEQMINKPFSGPPETTRDTVIVAGLALHEGNWRRCRELVLGLKVWSLWATRGWETVAERYESLIRETGLKTYLVAFAPHYDSMSMASLCSMFLLEEAQVHSLVSKMMINKELLAAWDQPTSSIVMHKIHISPLQHLALEFADKAGALVESNERLLNTRTGQFSREDSRGDRGSRYLSVGRLRRRGFDPRKGDKGEGYGFFSASAAKRQGGGGRRGPRARKDAQSTGKSNFWAKR